MEKNSKSNLELAMNDCLQRAEVCAAGDEDYLKLINNARAIGEVLNEQRKIEVQREIEMTKIENENDASNPKFLLGMLIPIAGEGLMLGFRYYILRKQTRDVCYFEKNYSFTTQAGKSLGRVFNDLLSMNKRGR